ncbi:MAG TPA: phosphoesterase [Pirellulales bacterium]
MSTESVLVVPTRAFHAVGPFQGFCRDADRYLAALLTPDNLSFRPRDEVEEDPRFKQLIPYVILRCEGKIFTYRRGGGQGEKRLRKLKSVGVGGHISLDDHLADAAPSQWYDRGLRRELEEEVAVDSPYTEKCVGLINDDQTEVGRVHLGVVHVFDLDRPAVAPREDNLVECGFLTVEEVDADLTSYETWSQICVQALRKHHQQL